MSTILTRPLRGRVVAGVCLAVANRLGLDVTVVRAVAVIAGLAGGGIAAYLVLWVVIPKGV